MRIAINASDLDHARIDGTRIYIQNLLKNFGLYDEKDRFLIYHKGEFNPQLEFPRFPNYEIQKIPFPHWWTQTRFAWEIFRTKPEVLWMPMHSLPYLRSKKTKSVATIHDLAFKFFPEHYPASHVRRLNAFTAHAVGLADRLIAISDSTKKDILKLYPGVREEKIKVIYHGYNKDLFKAGIGAERIQVAKSKYKISFEKYFIYVGALQPRKNLPALIAAFELLQAEKSSGGAGLVIAGDPGWMYEDVVKKIKSSENVMATGKFETEDLPALLAGSLAFVLPSLYEGFGLPLIEAMACGTPVIAANNSSLKEIVGDYGLLFRDNDVQDLARNMKQIVADENLVNDLRGKSIERATHFSWEKSAKETLDWLTKWN